MKKYRDHYFQRAKQENYPARSVYKLQEIDKRFKVLRQKARVLDLGAAPGSWTLFAAKKAGPAGTVLAVDLQDTDTIFPDNVTFCKEDVFEPSPELEALIQDIGPFDLVMSDMAPKTTGIKFADQARSLELAHRALDLALERLVVGGGFVVKIFQGPDDREVVERMRPLFQVVKTFKPKSSRAESKETFYVGTGFKGKPEATQPDAE